MTKAFVAMILSKVKRNPIIMGGLTAAIDWFRIFFGLFWRASSVILGAFFKGIFTVLWDIDSSFPASDGRWSAWRPPFGRKVSGEMAVRRALKGWHPLDSALVSVEGSKRALPPICYPELAGSLQSRMLAQYMLLMLLMIAMAAGFSVVGFAVSDHMFQKAGLVLALFLVFVGLQYFFIYRDRHRLAQFSRFSSWCYLQPYLRVVGMVGVLVVAGAIQYFVQASEGGLVPVVERYGLVFSQASAEPWRYLTGPFFHSGLPHWLANVSLLAVAAALAFALGRTSVIWLIFLIGVLVPGVLLTFLPHWVGRDAFLGVSGGVYALYGWLGGVTFRRRLDFPKGLWWVIAYFATATLLAASLLDPRASWFAHVFGLLAGYAAGLALVGLRSELRTQNI
ncbi:rhomboid family intramembrane serine protease [Xanthomonas oryzae]|uniref:rhomboid family intramembrane serine protease n=1 Tax=Xanthomonas oryzae TaxID=347 RepID=UPI002DEC2E71|nr:rhomboid family intramembrane serine protease [Xanthomonas oryzae pv. oryzicola]MEC5114045.1 rhomboid family intramembrane serine protease [Xanthomonas oryzae pv. oryzicola]